MDTLEVHVPPRLHNFDVDWQFLPIELWFIKVIRTDRPWVPFQDDWVDDYLTAAADVCGEEGIVDGVSVSCGADPLD